ncbi:MAG TPA: hypothetical protein VFQ36_21555 [Ktedonobacteraceae bacterium]|nr:hypothetical protein [Ktedonobacteraceae bacterium]
MPPVAPVPKRRRPPLTVILLLLLIFGGVFVGIRIGQSRYNVSTNLPALTPTGNSTLNASQLYQQLTSQKPFVVDPLQDPSSSIWTVFEKPKYGCEIKSDGLHVHILDPNHVTYCTSGRGRFSNFGFQIEIRMLSGTGGLTLRGDTTAGNLYFFHVFPDGQYRIFIEQNHNWTTELSEGTISSFTHGPGQKNTLAVIAQGSHMYFYVNRKFVTQVQDSTYSNGFLGVSVSDSTEPAEVIYTNAQIWVL